MKNVIFIISTLLLFSCVNENTLHNSFPIQLLNGNSAKVWVLSKSSNPQDESFSELKNYRKSFIFYANKTFREQELIHLGSNQGFKGKYTISENRNGDIVLSLYYTPDDVSYFRVNAIENDFLTLQNLESDENIWEFRSLIPPRL